MKLFKPISLFALRDIIGFDHSGYSKHQKCSIGLMKHLALARNDKLWENLTPKEKRKVIDTTLDRMWRNFFKCSKSAQLSWLEDTTSPFSRIVELSMTKKK